MEPNLSFLASRPVSPAASEPSAVPASSGAASATQQNSDFAQVLNGQTLKAQRQQLAAMESPGQGLQVVPLGNKINVITSDAPLPDMDSLAQFARLQGLDEAAVQALFGAIPQANAVSPVPGTPAAEALTPLMTPADPLGLATVSALVPLTGLALPPTTPSTPLPAGNTKSPGDVQALLAGTAARDLKVQIEVLSMPPSVQASPAAAPAALFAPVVALAPPATPADLLAATPVTATVVASAAQSSLLPMQAAAWLGKAEVAAADAVEPAPALAPQDAVRLTLAMPAPEITKRLAQMSGTGKESTWAALLASGPASKELPPATDTITLDLPAGFDAELLLTASDLSPDQPSDLSTQAGAGASAAPVSTAGSSAGSNAGNTQAQADHRAQQFQQLADQMGQAAAQRLMAQIERGQWKMHMRMQPAALGTINVELDMHSGGLDALFSTDNAVTRDLMSQGSNKLRDTLTQSGMTVASVSVNGEQSRQSGGNSTPGKGRGTPFAGPAAGVTAAAAASPASAGPVAENDGLNLLA